MDDRIDVWRKRCRIGLAVFYGVAGILHILIPEPFLGITPSWVPAPADVIGVTGVCEMIGAAGLLIPGLRKYAAIGLALYAVCVFPANIKHALDALSAPPVSFWQWIYHILRQPLQPVLVCLPLFAGNLIDWPWRASR